MGQLNEPNISEYLEGSLYLIGRNRIGPMLTLERKITRCYTLNN